MKTTFRSKLLALFAAFLVICGTAAGIGSASATTASDAKMALARSYIDAMPVESDVRAAVEQLATAVQPDQRLLFRSLADKSIDYTLLKNSAVALAADMFSEEELKAMTKFYTSPEGKSSALKMGRYQERLQPIMMQTLQGFVTKLQQNNIQITPPAQ